MRHSTPYFSLDLEGFRNELGRKSYYRHGATLGAHPTIPQGFLKPNKYRSKQVLLA